MCQHSFLLLDDSLSCAVEKLECAFDMLFSLTGVLTTTMLAFCLVNLLSIRKLKSDTSMKCL